MSQPQVKADGSALIRADQLTKTYSVEGGWFKRNRLDAVKGVNLSIQRGEVVALVGESGSGKSTLGRMLVRLSRSTGGRIWFEEADITHLSGSSLRRFRKRVGIVFQNPYGSLNPRMSIGDTLAEPLHVWSVVPDREIPHEVSRLLDSVGLPASYVRRFPHALSGGERQRVAISRALSVHPEFLVADEVVSSLDVSAAAEIINLLLDLHANLGLAVLFLTHDLSAARVVADRIAVMHEGEIVETGTPEALFSAAQHPYTQLLLSSQLRLG